MVTARSVAILAVGAFAVTAACKRSPTDPILEVPTLPTAPINTIVVHDSVDTENGGVGANNWKSFQNWEVVDGCVDLHGNGFYDVLAGNGLYIDLDGTCMKGGTIQSKTPYDLEQGVNYTLEFWLAGNQRIAASDTVDVSLGNLYSERFVLARREPFRVYTRTINVTAATQARLRFRNYGGDNQGALLDQVRLRRTE